MKHGWSKSELLDLLETADAGGDCWGYCAQCGAEIYPVEPDIFLAWCPACCEEVPVRGMACSGLI